MHVLNYNKYLEALQTDKKKFATLFKDFVGANTLGKSIRLLKLLEVGLNRFGGKPNQILIEDCLRTLNLKFGENQIISDFQLQISLINSLFRSFKDDLENLAANKVHRNNQMGAFLLANEILLSTLILWSYGASTADLNNNYPFFFQAIDDKGNPVSPQMFLQRSSRVYDNIVENISEVIKYLSYHGAKFGKVNKILPINDVRQSREHISVYGIWQEINHIVDIWKFYGGRFLNSSEGGLEFKEPKSTLYLSTRIASVRSSSRDIKWQFEFQKRSSNNSNNANASRLAPMEFISDGERFACIYCHEYFKAVDLSFSFENIQVVEWIRAYSIIQMMGEYLFYSRGSIRTFSLSANSLVLRFNEIKAIFIQNGISAKTAPTLIKFLTLDSSSKDIFDTPLIPIDNRFLISPIATAFLNPARAMLSNLVNRRIDISVRGHGFAEYLNERLRAYFPDVRQFSFFLGTDEYECDAAFIADSKLFIWEMKAFLQPHSPYEHYQNMIKLQKSAHQLKRLSKALSENPGVVAEKLRISLDLVPKELVKVVCTASMIGFNQRLNGCYYVDESALIKFLDRDPPGFTVGDTRYTSDDAMFTGKLDGALLFNFLKEVPQVSLANRQFSLKDRIISTSSLTVNLKDYTQTVPDFTIIDEATEAKIKSRISSNGS